MRVDCSRVLGVVALCMSCDSSTDSTSHCTCVSKARLEDILHVYVLNKKIWRMGITTDDVCVWDPIAL